MYSEQEAEEILRLATRKDTDGISRDRLMQMAEELGISPEAVANAENTVRTQREEIAERREFDLAQKRSFFSHVASFVVVNAGLVAFNLIDEGHISWALWVIAAWGLGIGSRALRTFLRGSEGYQKDFETWQRSQRLRAFAPERGPTPDAGGLNLTTNATSTDQFYTDLFARLDTLVRRDNLARLEAIKVVREQTGLGLVDAKNAVDVFERERPGIFRR